MMAKFLSSTVLLIWFVNWIQIISAVTDQSKCSETARMDNWSACLVELIALLEDSDKYYFGNNYNTICPDGMTVDCFTNYPPPPHSIITRMQKSTSEQMQTSDMNRWLEIQFTSPAGSYTGCDYLYEETESETFSLNPLLDVNHTPWSTRMQPQVSWSTSEDASGQLYTLLLQDVGYGTTHGLWMNILGTDISTATAIREYRGPGNPREAPNPYVYFLFKQEQKIESLNQTWTDALADVSKPAYLQKHWLGFMADNYLSGPVAVNWMSITGDTYAAQGVYDFGFNMNCAFYVKRELEKQTTRMFLPSSLDLSVFMRVNYNSITLNMDICCNPEEFKGENVYLNPIGSGMIAPATTRQEGSSVSVTLHKNKMYPNDATDFQGEYYTLAMVDPDAPPSFSSFGNNERPYAHWLVIDIPGRDVSSGTELFAYAAPGPSDMKPHTYFFLLYKQKTSSLTTVNTTEYSIPCPSPEPKRCQFDVKSFASDNEMSLAGASWMLVQNDLYLKQFYIDEGILNETIACENVSGFETPCPDNGVSSSSQNGIFILMVLLINVLAF